MALDLTTGSSGVFRRFADFFGAINEANAFSATTIVTRTDTIADDFATFATQRQVIGDLDNQAVNVRSDLSDWSAYLTQLVNDTLVAMCLADTALPVSTSVEDLFVKLNRDMVAKPASFMRPTVTGTIAAGTNVGDGFLITSVIEPIDGINCMFAYSEVIRLIATSDSYSGGSTAGSETFSIASEASVDKADPLWPKGAGATSSITAVSRDTDAILTDGALEEWGGTGNNTPTDWSINGTAGTNITRGSSSPYEGTFYLTMTGDAATTVGIYQNILANIQANKNYAFQFWIKVPATLTTTQLQISLMDGSSNILTDNATTSQATVISTATLNAATSWTRVSGVLRTARSLTTEVRLDIRCITAVLQNAKTIQIDAICMAELEQLYPGGPYHALIAGATPFALNDSFTNTISNSAGTGTFVRNLDRVFNLADNNIRVRTLTGAASGVNPYDDTNIA